MAQFTAMIVSLSRLCTPIAMLPMQPILGEIMGAQWTRLDCEHVPETAQCLRKQPFICMRMAFGRSANHSPNTTCAGFGSIGLQTAEHSSLQGKLRPVGARLGERMLSKAECSLAA